MKNLHRIQLPDRYLSTILSQMCVVQYHLQVERDAPIFKTWLEARLGARKRKVDKE